MDNSGHDIGPHDEEYMNGLEMDSAVDVPPDEGNESFPIQSHSLYTSSQENNVSSMPPDYTQHRVYGTDQVIWRRHFEEPIDMTPPEQNPLNRADALPEPVPIVHNPMHIESNRLKTFVGKWPAQAHVTPQALARDGFIYVGPGDRVRCVFCTGVLKLWVRGDVVREEHKKHYPHCVVNRVRAAGRQATPSHQAAGDTERSTTADLGVKSRDTTTADCLGIVENKPKHPKYVLESSRLGTFRDWPSQIKQKPEDMAKAGLYYLGKGDRVKCFSCDGLLHTWDPTDDPMGEHARWFPECAFVKLVNGGNSSSSDSRNGRTVADADCLENNASVQALVDNGCKLEDISRAIEQLHLDGVGQNTIPSAVAIWKKIEEKSKAPDRSVVVENGHSQGSDDVQALLNENRELKEQRLCKVCLEKEISVIFLPCGHLTCCSQCATSLSECPICRGKINGSAKAFWP